MDAPVSGSRDPVVLTFDEPMDPELLRTRIRIRGSGSAVPGEATLDPAGAQWTFTPHAPWAAGDYHAAFSGELEDLAGNTSTRLFDHAVGWKPDRSPTTMLVFTVR